LAFDSSAVFFGPDGGQPATAAETETLRRSVARSQPFGSAAWQEPTADRLGLQSILRALGRPRKQTGKARE